MRARLARRARLGILSVLLLGASACAHGSASAPTKGVVVTMTRMTVTPTPKDSPAVTWDAGAQDSQDDAGCGLLIALDFVAAPLGAVASTVCSMASSGDRGGQWRSEDPDLFARFEVGSTSYTSPVIADRASHDLAWSLFLPREALRDELLALSVYDLDGAGTRQSTLIADVELREGQLDGRLELRGADIEEPSLELLRLEFGDPPRPQSANHAMSADEGLVALDNLEIPAGMLVEVRATGSYRIGSWNDARLGPEGYPGGGPRDYNLPGEVFRRARHGAAVALVQHDSAAQAVVVGSCVRFVTSSGGTLYVGVNDREHRNNSGELGFAVRVTTPSTSEWSRGGVLACD